jgi:hypothetical protein
MYGEPEYAAVVGLKISPAALARINPKSMAVS